MIRLGPQIRLTRKEIQQLHWLTDIEPVGIRTLADLEAYVAKCKAHYWGVSEDTQVLRLVIQPIEHCQQTSKVPTKQFFLKPLGEERPDGRAVPLPIGLSDRRG